MKEAQMRHRNPFPQAQDAELLIAGPPKLPSNEDHGTTFFDAIHASNLLPRFPFPTPPLPHSPSPPSPPHAPPSSPPAPCFPPLPHAHPWEGGRTGGEEVGGREDRPVPHSASASASGAMMSGFNAYTNAAYSSLNSVYDQARRLIRGSADDIGWLQRDLNYAPVIDRTERYATLLGRISHGIHCLPDTLVYLLVPGLFSNLGPLYFTETKRHFSKLGLICHIAKIHSEASIETNARELRDSILELFWGCNKRVVILGHSKGALDAAAAVSLYPTELGDKVVGIVFAQSPYGGTPLASDMLRRGQLADGQWRWMLETVMKNVLKGDLASLDDLTYDRRRAFLAAHPLPSYTKCVSFHSQASKGASAVVTWSQIAHTDVPFYNVPVGVTEQEALRGKFAIPIPLAAVMATAALQMDIRYNEESDGMVTRRDAEVPGSVVVRPARRFDHGWLVFSPASKSGTEVDAPQMCEALVTLLLDNFRQERDSELLVGGTQECKEREVVGGEVSVLYDTANSMDAVEVLRRASAGPAAPLNALSSMDSAQRAQL